jgi:hypothetical protein
MDLGPNLCRASLRVGRDADVGPDSGRDDDHGILLSVKRLFSI